ncbi:MAG: DUF5916 domain-containing protein [bacterium]
MRNLIVYKLLFVIMFIFFNGFAQQKECFAVKTDSPPIIDGDLSDKEWDKANLISDFTQQEPAAGNSASFNTEVKILYDNNNIYFSIMCYDDEPEKIVAREMKWDGYLSKDDYFRIIFDTFNDNRNAYWFAINPLSAQNDALICGIDYSGFNEDWDGVWDVKSKITNKGWQAEVVYPFSTFKFFNQDEQTWGINFERGIKRFDEVDLWASVGSDKGLIKIAEAGDLKGIKGIRRGDPIYIVPYITGGAEFNASGNKYVHEPGVDIKYGITETLSLDLTINTDFAQVESDRAQINLTRFPLFFQEKRDFFLEGVNTFKFNMGGSNTLFYSRRIGIGQGEEIPLIGGAKLVGRVGDYEIGVLDVQTAAKNDELSTNYSVTRLKYDLFNQSYAGVIFTNKQTKDGFNRGVGADCEFTFNNFLGDKNLIITSRIAKSFENNNPSNTWAGYFAIDLPNDVIDQFVSYSFFQDHFNPQLGFIKRGAIQQYSYYLSIAPWINKYNIRRLNISPTQSSFYFDSKNELQQASMYFQPIGFNTSNGHKFYLGIERNFDYIKENFEIFDTTKIRPGKYWFTTYSTGFLTSTSEAVYGQADFEIGNFYNGYKKTYSATITSVFSKHLIFEGDFEYNKISISSSRFSTYEFGSRIKYNISTQMLSSVFCQWNNDNKELNFNYRFNWKPKTGSDFYLVINHLLETSNKIRTKDFVFIAKFSWLFII